MACRFSVSVDQVLKNVSQFLCFPQSYIHRREENLEAMQKGREEHKARQADVWRRVEGEEDTKCTVEELERLEGLESLNIEISSSSALEELFSADGLAGCIKEVCIRDVKEEAHKTLVLPTMEHLSKLIIRSCDIWDIEVGRTPWDIFLTKARLRNLTSVIVTGCNGLKDLTWLLFVPNLTHLELQCLEKVQEVISKEKVASTVTDEPKVRGMNAPFQKLERLNLIKLPRLKSIYWSPLLFPCLKKIKVEKCPKLRKLPLSSEGCVGGEELVINYRD